MPKYLKITLLIIASATFCLVALGGFVRATGAGLACPDWPLCFGRVVPPTFQDGVFQEWAHRKLALVVSLGTVFFALRIYPRRKQLVGFWSLSIVLLSILFVQVILGGLTVIMKLNPFIVTSHLLFGTLFFQLCSIAAINSNKEDAPVQGSKKLRMGVAILSILVFLQIIIGGFVGSSGAALVCPDIPLCLDGNFLPENGGGAQHLHMTHRSLGIFIALSAILLSIAIAKSDVVRGIKAHTFGLLFLIFAQVVVGFLNVYYLIPVSLTVIHLALAEAILLGYLVLLSRLNGSCGWYCRTN